MRPFIQKVTKTFLLYFFSARIPNAVTLQRDIKTRFSKITGISPDTIPS